MSARAAHVGGFPDRLEPKGDMQTESGSFTSIERVGRVGQVRDQLERAIERGDYKPGDRLPSERELVDMLGVSRITLREALRSLEALGWIEVQHGRGCFVVERTSGYPQEFGRWLGVHRDELLELLRVRGALDGVAAETAAERADAAAIASLRAAQAAFAAEATAAEPDLTRLCELDVAFHEEIGRASRSLLIQELLNELNAHLTESRKITLAPPGRPLQSAREHEEVVDAIAQGRPEEARQAVVRHLAAVTDALAGIGQADRR